MNLILHKPEQIISGDILLPGSKSISNRVLIIKALSGLDFDIENLSDSDDTRHLKDALESYHHNSVIDVGHAGTDMRFLTAFLSLKNGDYELTGSERLQQRPIKDLVDVLKSLSADINYKNNEGYPPLYICGRKLEGGKVEINGNVSSQFISALLLVAPYFINGLEIRIITELVSKPYVNMTIEIMKEFGASVEWRENIIKVSPKPYSYDKKLYIVESDWSAASYYYSLVALSSIGTKLVIKSLFKNSLQADSACAHIYNDFGISTNYEDNLVVISKTEKHRDKKLELDFIECPDIAQTVVCSCVGLQMSFVFKGLQTLKVKETDRIIALQNECKKLGIELSVTNNSIEWNGEESINKEISDSIVTYNDHRMAMSFAPLCLLVQNITIENAEVVSKSYPEFWQHLKFIGINYTQIL